MYQIFLRMYLGFQFLFQGGKRLLITSQGFPNEQMDHRKMDRGSGSLKIGYTKFFEGSI